MGKWDCNRLANRKINRYMPGLAWFGLSRTAPKRLAKSGSVSPGCVAYLYRLPASRQHLRSTSKPFYPVILRRRLIHSL